MYSVELTTGGSVLRPNIRTVLRGYKGLSPTVSVTTISGGKRITVTDADGDHVCDIMNGADWTPSESEMQTLATRAGETLQPTVSALSGTVTGLNKKAAAMVDTLPEATAQLHLCMRAVYSEGRDTLYMCMRKNGAYYWRKLGTISALGDLELGENELGGDD